MLRRGNPDASPDAVFTVVELEFLDRSSPNAEPASARNLDFYMIRVVRLGGYLGRRHDAPPGATVLWRRFPRLADLVERFVAGKEDDRFVGDGSQTGSLRLSVGSPTRRSDATWRRVTPPVSAIHPASRLNASLCLTDIFDLLHASVAVRRPGRNRDWTSSQKGQPRVSFSAGVPAAVHTRLITPTSKPAP